MHLRASLRFCNKEDVLDHLDSLAFFFMITVGRLHLQISLGLALALAKGLVFGKKDP